MRLFASLLGVASLVAAFDPNGGGGGEMTMDFDPSGGSALPFDGSGDGGDSAPPFDPNGGGDGGFGDFDPNGGGATADDSLGFDPSGGSTLPFDPNGGSAPSDPNFDPQGGGSSAPVDPTFDPNGGGGDAHAHAHVDDLDMSHIMNEGSGFDPSVDVDIANLMNTVSDLPPSALGGGGVGESIGGGAPAPGGGDDGININALMDSFNHVTPVPTPSFDDQLHALQDDDPNTFGAYDGTGIVGGGTCMGGYVRELDLYLDCTKMLGFLAIVNSEETTLDKLGKLQAIEEMQDMSGPRGNGLYIGNNSQLLNTAGLASLSLVAGGLTIEENPKLTSTGGVGNNLHSVGVNSDGESIVITNNPALIDVGEWDLWKGEVSGGLTVEDNLVLAHLNGMSGLKSVGGGITIRFNPVLSDISGLENLNSVGKDVSGNSVIVVENNNLKDLRGLRGLQGMLQGAVHVANNKALLSLDGLQQVLGIGKDENGVSLNITNNALLTSLEALEGLSGRLDGSVTVMLNPSLRVLAGLQAISEIGADEEGNSLSIVTNTLLNSMLGFSGLKSVDGAVAVTGNDGLPTLEGLAPTSINGKNTGGSSLDISNNNMLASVRSLGSLTGALPGALTVAGNKKLQSLDGLQNVDGIDGKNLRGYAVEVIMNDELVDLTGLDGLNKHLNGGVVISDNAALQDMNGFNAESLGGNIEVKRNGALENIDATGSVTRIDGDATIKGNAQLQNIVALETGLQGVGKVVIEDVLCMSTTDVAQLTKVAASAQLQPTNSEASCDASSKKHFGDKSRTVVGVGPSAVCGAMSGAKSSWAEWSQLGSSGIYTDVDTSGCEFDVTPNYVSAMYGDTAHWQLVGVNSIYNATAKSFRVYAFHPVLRGKFMRYFAERYHWRLSWMADGGKTSGHTKLGNTGWAPLKDTKNVLYADVNTEKCEYEAAPRYVTSLQGGNNHWKAQGIHSIYEPNQNGFRVFLVYPTAITAQYAESQNWAVSWVGSTNKAISGRSSSTWTKFNPPREEKVSALFIDVDTSNGHFAEVPAYVTSVEGYSHHWMVTGAASVYAPTTHGFRVYLDNAQSAKFAAENKWRVNYITASGSHDCHVSDWTAWGTCSATCGGGTAEKSRIVLQTATGKGACNFALKESRACATARCVIDCAVSAWAAWAPCSATCSTGTTSRVRTVATMPSPGGKPCPIREESKACDAGACPSNCQVSRFSDWSACTLSCGTGEQTRSRKVVQRPEHGGFSCPVLVEARQCNTQFCPVNCREAEWGGWTVCTKSCGWGMHTKTRTVAQPAQHGGKACGLLVEVMPCHTSHCPVHCSVSPFSLWDDCSKTCGGVVHRRTRTVLAHAQHRGYECPSLSQEKPCNTEPCAIDCVVSEWSTWGACTKSCSGGTQERTRTVTTVASLGGRACPVMSEDRACSSHSCPVDCETTAWTPYSHCSATCGEGTRWRMREVISHAQYGGKECSERFQQKHCDSGPCATHCEVSAWTGWTPCTKSCGTGTQQRARTVTKRALNGGSTCPSLTDERECNSEFCPEDCVVSEWGPFSKCSKTCSSTGTLFAGSQKRERTILRKAVAGGRSCPALVSRQDCNTQPCPSDCVVSVWRPWTECSATCGDGLRTRSRTVQLPPQHGGDGCPFLSEVDNCDAGTCPVHCEVDPWTSFSACDKTCGRGSHTRSRNIVRHAHHGGFACPALFEVAFCNDHSCPVDCELTRWSAWGACSATCRTGIKLRRRTVAHKAKFGGRSCSTVNLVQETSCKMGPCPSHCEVSDWGSWSACSQTCRKDRNGKSANNPPGTRHRSRTVTVKSAFGGFVCPALNDEETCGEAWCAEDCSMTTWGGWSTCSVSCGVGEHVRAREVRFAARHGGAACPATKDTRTCDRGPCPVHCSTTPWSVWGECSLSCGGGRQGRSRSVAGHAQHGGYICPALTEERDCSMQECPIDCKTVAEWGPWGPCSADCAGGTRSRSRKVTQKPRFGGIGCPLLNDAGACNTAPCVIDCAVHTWEAWSSCSSTCGSGTQRTTRAIKTQAQNGGKACPALEKMQGCNSGSCPLHCEVSAWSIWSGCTLSCGGGKQTRVRVVNRHAVYGGFECPALQEERQCHVHHCPIDCVVDTWGSFSPCSKSCENHVLHESSTEASGQQHRYRQVLRDPSHGGRKCPPLSDTQACNRHSCPVDCLLDNWGAWTPCSVTCGTGNYLRSRAMIQNNMFGGRACDGMLENDSCEAGPCPIHCEVDPWGSWGKCTATCGSGKRVRTRSVRTHANHGGFQCPVLNQVQTCNPHACAVDCQVSEYGSFGACSLTCGGGSKIRERVVVVPVVFGGKPCPSLAEYAGCNEQACPVDCSWSRWGTWGTCSRTCNEGQQMRARTRAVKEQHGGKVCVGNMQQRRECNVLPCPVHCTVSSWHAWQVCSKSCGSGTQTRARFVTTRDEHGGYVCPNLSESRECNIHACPVDCKVSPWSEWENFAQGGGKLKRVRTVEAAAQLGGAACPALAETKMWHSVVKCESRDVYGMWSQCTMACGAGHRYRYRKHIMCSNTAVVQMHMVLREGAPCHVRACHVSEVPSRVTVDVPSLPEGIQQSEAGIPQYTGATSTQLSEELGGRWVSVTAAERKAYSLAAGSEWHRFTTMP
jgi:hypothetical protein